MSISEDIARLIKGKIVIRHRSDEESSGGDALCMICSREMTLPPGSVSLAVGDEGVICSVCGNHYAPHMTSLLQTEIPAIINKSISSADKSQAGQVLDPDDARVLEEDIKALLEVTESLSRGVARGIVEAPAGHIGLMHYAKDIRRPPQRENETDKDYEMRVRTFRITRLYEKIHEDTTERVERIREVLRKSGFGVS